MRCFCSSVSSRTPWAAARTRSLKVFGSRPGGAGLVAAGRGGCRGRGGLRAGNADAEREDRQDKQRGNTSSHGWAPGLHPSSTTNGTQEYCTPATPKKPANRLQFPAVPVTESSFEWKV